MPAYPRSIYLYMVDGDAFISSATIDDDAVGLVQPEVRSRNLSLRRPSRDKGILELNQTYPAELENEIQAFE